MKKVGDVYVIHFDKSFKGCRHYIGFTTIGINKRLEKHRKGLGSRLLNAVNNAGIEYNISAAIHNVPQILERKLKRQKNSKRFCPVCNPNSRGLEICL